MKILFATDGTKHSKAAEQILENFNFMENSELNIISVVDMAVPFTFDMFEGYTPSTIEIESKAKELAKNILEETKNNLKKTFPQLRITTEVLLGSPESRIVERAEEMKVDLIILGSHGYNRWERLLLGSVSDSVVHHAPCSVLIVRN